MGNKLKVVPITKGLADVPKFKTVLIAKGSGPAEPKQDPREIAKTKAEGSYVTAQEGKGRYKGLKYAQGRDKDMAKSGEGVNNGHCSKNPEIKINASQWRRIRRSSPGTSSAADAPGRARALARFISRPSSSPEALARPGSGMTP